MRNTTNAGVAADAAGAAVCCLQPGAVCHWQCACVLRAAGGAAAGCARVPAGRGVAFREVRVCLANWGVGCCACVS